MAICESRGRADTRQIGNEKQGRLQEPEFRKAESDALRAATVPPIWRDNK